ncbi:cytochrome c maturation protein CcmE [Sphingomonas sp. DT-51]|uniref:cytochrome c maturation protein CcmE n=1 Tax=Sphingomonas sp. DT-51 TaxID=3396165 RepID=UPI003F1A39D9
MTPKSQRMTLVALGAVALAAAALLALSGLRSQAAFFYAPSDVRGAPPAPDKAVRLGGMVERGSLRRAQDGVSLSFTVTDGKSTTPVRFSGIAPDLFREGSGVVAEGHFNPDASFTATNLLAKHDEKYMPPQMARKMHETRTLEPR